MYSKATAPLSIAGVLDQGFKLYRYALPLVFLVSAGAGFISGLPNVIFAESLQTNPQLDTLGLFFTLTLLLSLVPLLAFIATIKKIRALTDDVELSWGDAFKASLSRLIHVFVVAILYTIAVTIGLFLLVIPGIYLSIAFIFAMILVIDKDIGIIDSFKRSMALVQGNWWRTTAIFTVILFIVMTIYVLIGLTVGIGAFLDPSSLEGSTSWIDLIVVPLLQGLLSPVFYAFLLVVLDDLQLRKDGTDLEDRISSIE